MNSKVAKATSAAHARTELDKNEIVDEFATIAIENIAENHRATNTRVGGVNLMSTTSCSSVASESANKLDGRKINRGSVIRKKHSDLEKAHIVENHENACRNLTVAEWVRQMNVGRECEKYLVKLKPGCRNYDNEKSEKSVGGATT